MGNERDTRAGHRRQAERAAAAVLVGLVLLILGAHAFLRWRLNTAHVQQRLAAAVAAATDSLYVIRIGSARFSLLGRSARLRGVELFPDTAAFARRGRVGRPEHTRYRLTAASLQVEGLGLARFFRRQLWARSAALDSLQLEIEVDRTLPRSPNTPATLPHQALQQGRPFHIDRLQVSHSQVTYLERASDGTRFGRLPFTELNAVISNISNDPLFVSRHTPCVIEVTSRFAAASRLRAVFDYDLAARLLNLNYHVSFGPMPAEALNPFLVSLEGVRVREGALDSADLSVQVRDELARGKLTLLYHDLEIETLDKTSRHRGVSDKVQTFLFNHFTLHEKNPEAGQPALVATLVHRRSPEIPLFKFIWLTLRDGVFETLGL